jgi:hypothetical protein
MVIANSVDTVPVEAAEGRMDHNNEWNDIKHIFGGVFHVFVITPFQPLL